MFSFIKTLMSDETGAAYTEYGLLAVLIAVAAVMAVGFFGESVLALFNSFPLSVFE